VITGTPRQYAFGPQFCDNTQAKRQGKTSLYFEVRQFDQFNVIKQLLPANCLAFIREEIPGLKTDTACLPQPRTSLQAPFTRSVVEFLPKTNLYLHDLAVKVSPAFEFEFENFLKEYVRIQTGENCMQVSIEDRKLRIGVHNGWKNMSVRETEAVLNPPDKNMRCTVPQLLCLQDYITDPICALTFSVSFTALLPTKPRQEV